MISVHIRKRLIPIFATNSSFLCKSHVPISLAHHLFSTSIAKKDQHISTFLDLLLNKHRLSPGVVSIVDQLKSPEICDQVLSFLKEAGFSSTQLEKIVKSRPEVLSARIDTTLKPKIKIFEDLGLSVNEIAEIISKEPTILCCSMSNRVIPSLSVLKGFLGSIEEVARVLKRSGWFLIRDLQSTMVPNVEFLISLGVPWENILNLLYTYPRCLLHKPETFKNRIEKVVDIMGSDRSSKLFIQALRVVLSLSDRGWDAKYQVLLELGFTQLEIYAMFRKVPQVFVVSSEKLKMILDILLATGKYDMNTLVNYPRAFTCSVKYRYMPRLQILATLEKKKLIKEWPTLSSLFIWPHERFSAKFVVPYINVVGHLDVMNCGVEGGRESKLITSAQRI